MFLVRIERDGKSLGVAGDQFGFLSRRDRYKIYIRFADAGFTQRQFDRGKVQRHSMLDAAVALAQDEGSNVPIAHHGGAGVVAELKTENIHRQQLPPEIAAAVWRAAHHNGGD
jgi:hypothetical protein